MPEDVLDAQGHAKKRYQELEPRREQYLYTAREASALTIPHLVPPEGWTDGMRLPTPYQGLGAQGVNNLSSKLLLALFPPNSPFFRMAIDDAGLKDLQAQSDESLKTKVEKALGKYERAVMKDIEASGDRVAAHEALRHLLVAGNVLLFVQPTNTRVFHLDQYVVKRDASGNVLEIVVLEKLAKNLLDEDFQKSLSAGQGEYPEVELYTYIYRDGNKFHVYQEVEGRQVPGSQGMWPIEKSPYIPLRFNRRTGESYGRSFVEEYLGDLISLDGLYQAIVEGAAAMAKLTILLDPNGTTDESDMVNAENGAVIPGREQDVSVVQMQKYADFRVVFQTIANLENRLSAAFLLTESVQRDAERVTAEEIRALVNELEDALGGLYSILAQEFQLPYVNRRIAILSKQGRLPRLPKDVVKPTIITGLEALGRGHDLKKLRAFVRGAAQDLGPEAVLSVINVDNYMSRTGTALGLDLEGLIKTPEEQQADRQRAMQQQIAQQATPEAVKQIGNAIQQRGEQSAQSPSPQAAAPS